MVIMLTGKLTQNEDKAPKLFENKHKKKSLSLSLFVTVFCSHPQIHFLLKMYFEKIMELEK